MPANTALGRLVSHPVKNIRQSARANEQNTNARGARARGIIGGGLRQPAAATIQGEHNLCRQANSHKCLPAAATRQGLHRPVTPGSHRRRASPQRSHHGATRTVYIRQATATAEESVSSPLAETSVTS